jgi:hypothetical protein
MSVYICIDGRSLQMEMDGCKNWIAMEMAGEWAVIDITSFRHKPSSRRVYSIVMAPGRKAAAAAAAAANNSQQQTNNGILIVEAALNSSSMTS